MIGKSKNSKSYREVTLEKTALLPKTVYLNIFAVGLFLLCQCKVQFVNLEMGKEVLML